MVSTRGPKYKFSQGERVLCYEPDPTKAKVLYDSKVLQVIEQKGKRGRRTVQYLIHFKGWNSSWDRYVGEELVLKDTEGNRLLQRTLAEKAQLQIGTYLYRKERKKGVSTSSASGTTTAGKRPRVSDFEDEELNNFSSQEEDVEEGQSEDVSQANSRSSTGGNSSSCEESDSSSEYNSDEFGGASIHIGPMLKERLTQDYELVVCGGRLLRLPCHPNALQVLEGCVMHHTSKTIAAHSPPPPQADIQEQARRLNILREVADGLRIYLDFILRDQLLYESERPQYYQAVANGMLRDTQSTDIKSEEECNLNLNKAFPEDYAHLPPSPINPSNVQIKCEPLSPSAIKSESESKTPPRINNELDQCMEWQNVRIKVEDNVTSNVECKEKPTHNHHGEWNNQSKGKINDLIKCEESRRSRDSPIRRFNRRETRTSSCNSEITSDARRDSVNDNGQYNSDAGSSMSSHDGSQTDTRNISEDCKLGTYISSVVNNKAPSNCTTDNGSVVNINDQDAAKDSNKINESITSESGRVLRGCVRKTDKTEKGNGSLTNNGSNSRNVTRNRRAKRPRLSARRLRSQRPRDRILHSLAPPLPPQVSAALPESQLDIPNSQSTPSQAEDTTTPAVCDQPGPSNVTENSVPTQPQEINGNINDEFKGALDWRIVQPDYPPYPTTIYGAVHLARLFVKLPEYLSVINMPESKLEIIVEFIEYFVKYLEEHAEWFGESFYYMPDTNDS